MRTIKILQIIFSGLLFLLSLNFLGCVESVHNNINREHYIGKFMFDTKKSNLGNLETEINMYEGLTLELMENDSFYFSMKAPFLRQQKGKWTMKAVDNLYTAYLLYENDGQGDFIKDHLIITPELEIKILTPFGNSIPGKEKQRYSNYLVFKKQ